MPKVKLKQLHQSGANDGELANYNNTSGEWEPVARAGVDDTAIHDNVSGEIAAITEKASPVGADLIIIEDSAAGNAKKKVQITNLPGGGGGDNIQVNATAASDANFSDTTPAAPAGEVNVKWQKDTTNPDNISASVQASSETQKGVIEIATQAETDTGTDDTRAVTPLKLENTTVAGIDSDAIHDNVSGEINAIAEKTVLVAADLLLIEDSAASNAKKKVQAGNLGTTTTFATTITAWTVSAPDNYADVVHNLGTKDVLVEVYSTDNDETVGVETIDRLDVNTVRIWVRTQENVRVVVTTGGLSNGNTDPAAIHDNVAGEIAAVTEKTTPVNADLLIIEDSADSNNKKRLQIGNLPGFPNYQFDAISVENPITSDWAVNALAPAGVDSNNSGLTVRLFDDTTEEGIGFSILIPSDAVNMKFTFASRAETAPGSAQTVALTLYERGIPDNGAVDSWSAAIQLTDVNIPTNENFQYDTQSDTLTNWGVTAGQIHQFELTRDTADAGDTLVGDWALLMLKVEFS